MLSKYSRVEFPSHICTFFDFSSFAFVEPLKNHRSSSTIPRKNIFFEVIRGKAVEISLKCIIDPKPDITFPLRVSLFSPFASVSFNKLKYPFSPL